MEDNFTLKEKQVFTLLHTLRRALSGGEMRIKWQGHDFIEAVLVEPKPLDGDNQEIDRMDILLTTMFGKT